MAKGDNTGIQQHAEKLDPNRFNRFGNPNNPVYGGGGGNMGRPMPPPRQLPQQNIMPGEHDWMKGQGGIFGPSSGILQSILEMLQGRFGGEAPGNRFGMVGKGIDRLKGNQPSQQKPKESGPTIRKSSGGLNMGQPSFNQPRIMDSSAGMMGGGMANPQMSANYSLNPNMMNMLGSNMRNFLV